MLRRLVKAPFIAGFVLLLFLLGTSCLERVRGFAPALGWPPSAVRAVEFALIGFFAFTAVLVVLNLFSRDD